MRYNNYHKHTSKSNIMSPDTHIGIMGYMERMKELEHDTYFTTEHGFGGDIFEARKHCDKYGYKCVFAIEAYCVLDNQPDPITGDKDNSNYHIMIIAKTDKARKQINLINSLANENGYYYKPRWSLKDILSLEKGSVYITTACISGIAKTEESIKTLLSPIAHTFGDDFFLEINHNDNDVQKAHNKKLLALSQKMRINLIHANDSHYIYPSQHEKRAEFLKGKKASYGDEDTYTLDYPSYDQILKAYSKQGVISEQEVKKALANTLLLDSCECININYDVKMPTIFPNLTIDEKHKKLKAILNTKFKAVMQEDDITDKEEIKRRIDGVKFEYDIIEQTAEVNTVDYFLLNERVVDLAVNKYGGFLSPTARGSGVSFYINRLLGFTQIDRFDAPIPLYPTRFMSISRILESKSLPDFDFNTTDPEPFIKATRELLGEHGCYPMITYGTMKESEAFRNVCRSMDMEFYEFNEVGKDLEAYADDDKWGDIIKKSEAFNDTVINMSIHPCAVLLMNGDIREEIGIIRTAKGMVCLIDSDESDSWNYLKNDFLTVTVWKIIKGVFDAIGQDVLSISQISKANLTDAWDIYHKGLTSTINQVDGDWATSLVKKYKPTNIAELTAFVAAIRPAFASLLNKFISRQRHSTGVHALDDVLADSYHYMLYQESIMKCLIWLSIEEDETYGIIKKVAKKVFKADELIKLKNTLRKNWEAVVGSAVKFDENWQVIEDSARYAFNAAHACAYAYDSLYGAYLKSKYPLMYYTVAFNIEKDNLHKTDALESELDYFGITLSPIKFRQSIGEYTYDKDTKTIYKGVGSVKHLNEQVANELYELRDNYYGSFVELLEDIKSKTCANTTHIEVLIKLDFFREFGKINYLLAVHDLFMLFWSSSAKRYKKQFKKSQVDELGFPHEPFIAYSIVKPMTYTDLIVPNIIRDLPIKYEPETIQDIIKYEQEYTGHISVKTGKASDNAKVCILEIRGKNKKKWLKAYSIGNGNTSEYRIYDKTLSGKKAGDLVVIIDMRQVPKIRYLGVGEDGYPIYEPDPINKEMLIEKIIRGE